MDPQRQRGHHLPAAVMNPSTTGPGNWSAGCRPPAPAHSAGRWRAGLPGNLEVEVEYRLEQRDLVIELTATTDARRPRSTSPATPTSTWMVVTCATTAFVSPPIATVPTDERSIPLGKAEVDGPFDLRQPRRIGADSQDHPQLVRCRGYDHCFLLDGPQDEPAVTWSRATSAFAWRCTRISPACSSTPATGWPAPRPVAAASGRTIGALPGGAATAGQPEPPRLGDPWLLPGQTYRHQTRYRLIPTDNSPLSRLPSPHRRWQPAANNIISWFLSPVMTPRSGLPPRDPLVIGFCGLSPRARCEPRVSKR